jgi:hypothetical protein
MVSGAIKDAASRWTEQFILNWDIVYDESKSRLEDSMDTCDVYLGATLRGL